MFTPQPLTPAPFGKITQMTHDEHKKLYEGYIKNANNVLEKIASYSSDETKVYETGELYRRFAFEYNGMRNHEVYFALASGTSTEAPTLHDAIARQWGDLATFVTTFTTLALTRGIGWALLSYDPKSDTLIMHWVDEQHLGQLQGTTPVIALDMWEHAYVADYQPSGKKQYVEDFLANLNWAYAEALYTAAKQKA
jgi:Fe-Mn family superoxide dismutase